MAKKKFSKEFLNRTSSSLCVNSEDNDLDLSDPLSYTEQTPGCSATTCKTDSGDTLDLSAPLSYTGQIHGFTAPARSSCSLDIRPLPSSSDIFKFGTAMGSLWVSGDESFARGVKRKCTEEENDGPRRKRQKIFHFEHSVPERGIKRKHESDHTESAFKCLKTWHKTDPPSFIIPCTRTCACHVGQSRVIPTKRRHATEASLLKEVLKENFLTSASSSQVSCCEKDCFDTKI